MITNRVRQDKKLQGNVMSRISLPVHAIATQSVLFAPYVICLIYQRDGTIRKEQNMIKEKEKTEEGE